MKFFTRAWVNGEVTDDDSDRTVAAYREHVAAISSRLSATVRALAQEISLHDAFVHSIIYDARGRQLEIRLLTGDLQVGYFDSVLTYGSAILDQADVAALRAAAEDPETELLYDEIDLTSDGEYLHRILFHPARECEIMFRDLALSMTPRADRRLVRLASPHVERRLPAR
jgi:hypothetical protein